MELWAVEGVAHCILRCLDVSTIDTVLHVIQAVPELHGYLQDGALWTQLSQLHFGGRRDARLQVQGILSPQNQAPICVELQLFLQSRGDRRRFHETVTVVEGDLQHVSDIDGAPLDAIVFPTNPHLTNHHVGAAAAVFRRAGPGLEEFVHDSLFRGARPVASAVVTPAFDAGVDKLIHCVGPSIMMQECYELLGATYENALNAVLRENLHCVAMASVSTGSLGVSAMIGGRVALRTIQKFLVGSDWQGKIAIVCKEKRVLQAFKEGKEAVLKCFNVLPPLPGRLKCFVHVFEE
ncbi:hypothetical protein PHYSODRAFT_318738 [Phytophthora sojae]|uniref:Macro domain-containing protein n=1 Tax=Phytophthora sojae (strain P6497) TaxID=1094619 RepID=G5A690_PHYSP|nr:hypothetical protein PHYSODRAFT_318738 [Phytophthora sojae]EGZ08845.1 hypothetical protein PHYSODRAFT_318738 [Phytophthora sojae]|eukprot:XP_009535478.1 hypothetical protein PHYSODRAFT_318738 [Phytophthora sojae]